MFEFNKPYSLTEVCSVLNNTRLPDLPLAEAQIDEIQFHQFSGTKMWLVMAKTKNGTTAIVQTIPRSLHEEEILLSLNMAVEDAVKTVLQKWVIIQTSDLADAVW